MSTAVVWEGVEPGKVRSAAAVRPLLVVQLAGTQAEMGYQHGALLRAVGGYERTMRYYPKMPEHVLAGSLHPIVVKTAGRALLGAMIETMERYRAPEYRARNLAFAEALGLPARYSRYTFVMDALQNVVGMGRRFGLDGAARRVGGAIPPACSTLSAWGEATEDGRLLHGRNFDFPGVGVWEEGPTVVFCSPDRGLRYGFVTTRGADVPGVSTFNEAGLSVTTHTRFHEGVVMRGVGIIDLVHDITRRAETLADAVRIVRQRPVASSWGIHVSSARERRAAVIETAGRLAEVVEPGAGEDFLACTNRYRHPRLMRDEVTLSSAFVANSDGRLERCRAVGACGGIGHEDLQALLGSHHDPVGGERERAAGSVVAQPTSVHSIVMDPERERLFVSVGPVPTGGGPWAEVPWEWSRHAGAGVVEPEVPTEPVAILASRFAQGAARQARDAYVQAVAIENRAGDEHAMLTLLEQATALDPDEPTYRMLAGALAFKRGELTRARAHLGRGLEADQAPFYRGQLLLWASRAAQAAGDDAEALRLRADLLAMEEPLLAEYQRAARGDLATPFTLAAMKGRPVRLHMVDVGM